MSIGQKNLRPFAEQGHYTAIHDPVFDEVMPRCPGNVFKVLMFVIRKTRGWGKDSDRLSVGEIQDGTGIGSENTARVALAWLLDQRMIQRVDGYSARDQRPYAYALNPHYEVTVADNDTPRKNRGRGTANIAVAPPSKAAERATSKTAVHNNHPPQQPSINNDGGGIPHPLPDEPSRPTERAYRERVEAWLSSDPLGAELAELIERVAASNDSGRMTWARKWNGHIAVIEGWRELYPEAAVRYALEETNRMNKADVRYAGGVLRNNPGGPPARNGPAPAHGNVTRLHKGRPRAAPAGRSADAYEKEAY